MRKLLITFIFLFCAAQQIYAAPSDINFSYIDSLKINSAGNVAWKKNVRDKSVQTSDISRLSLLYEKAIDKGLNKQDDYLKTVNLLIKLYDGNGGFREGFNEDGSISSENADDLTVSYSFIALSKALKSGGDYKSKANDIVKDIINKNLDEILSKYSIKEIIETEGIRAPSWLVNSRGDISAVYVLGLCEYYEISRDEKAKQLINALCEGLKLFAGKNYYEFPFAAHYENIENPNVWTLANNRQMSALAIGGKLLDNKDFIASAESSGDNLYVHLLSSYGAIPGLAPSPVIYPQTSEGAEVLTENLAVLADITKKEKFRILSGIAASWFYGGNSKYAKMYDPLSGRCFYTLTETGRQNDTSLRASINALTTLMSIYNTSSWDYRVLEQKSPAHCFIVLQMEDGKAVRKDYETEIIEYPDGTEGKLVAIKRENSFWLRFDIKEQGDYSFYLAYLKQYGFSTGTSILMRVDGDKIYSVPLGGSKDKAYMFCQEVLEPRELLPGVHSMGVKFSGLLLGKAAVLDSVLLQPLFQKRVLEFSSGKKIALIKSFYEETKSFSLNNLSVDKIKPYQYIGADGVKHHITGIGESIQIPAHGYVIIEGNGI